MKHIKTTPKEDANMKRATAFFKTSRTNKLITIAVVLIVIISGYLVIRSQASGFFASFQASAGILTGNVKLVSDGSAASGKVIQFAPSSTTTPPPPPTTPPPTTPPPTTPPPTTPPPSGGSTTTCPLPKYPNDSCTGVPAGTNLSPHNGDMDIHTANKVVSGMRITGEINIHASGVVIRNSEIYGTVKNHGTASFTIEDSTIGPTSGCSGHAALGHNNYTARRIKIRNHGEGIRVGDGPDGNGDNVGIYDSYVRLCDPGGDAHSDGIQGYHGGTNVRIEHNTIDQRPVPLARVTAPMFWSDGSGGGLQMINNMFAGGGYSIRVYHFGGANHSFTGNKLVNGSWGFGPSDSDCAKINWTNNSLVNVDSNYNITSTVGTLNCN